MRFFGVLPDGTARLIRMPGDKEQELAEQFRAEMSEFIQRQHLEFDAGYYPDKDEEVFRIPGFAFPEAMATAVEHWNNCGDLDQQRIKPGAVKAVFGAEFHYEQRSREEGDGAVTVIDKAIFKRLDKSRILSRSGYILRWDGDTFNTVEGPALTLGEGLDAVYFEGDLYLDSYRNAVGFLNLSSYFEDASDPEIDTFMNTGPFVFDGEGTVHRVANQTSRRLISMLIRNGDLTSISVSNVREQANELNFSLQTRTDNGMEVIVLPQDSPELKELLYFLNQFYFRGIFDDEWRRTNSARRIPRPKSAT